MSKESIKALRRRGTLDYVGFPSQRNISKSDTIVLTAYNEE